MNGLSEDAKMKLEAMRLELEATQKALLEMRDAFIKDLEVILPVSVDKAISKIISLNADLVEQLPKEKLAELKKELAEEKPKAMEKGLSSLRSSPEWLWSPSSGARTQRDPLDHLHGIRTEGAIWTSFEKYSLNLETIFRKHGFKIESGDYHQSVFSVSGLLEPDRSLHERNEAIGRAHREYYKAKWDFNIHEKRLNEAKARERFDSA